MRQTPSGTTLAPLAHGIFSNRLSIDTAVLFDLGEIRVGVMDDCLRVAARLDLKSLDASVFGDAACYKMLVPQVVAIGGHIDRI